MDKVELSVAGIKFKGVWIAIVLSFGSTIGGGIWAASEFFSRLESQEASVSKALESSQVVLNMFDDLQSELVSSIAAFSTRVSGVEQSLSDNDVSQLQGKLAELGANITQIMEQQRQLLDLRERIAAVEKSNSESVLIIEGKVTEIESFIEDITVLKTEINDLWNGLDAVANPLK